MRSSRIIVLFCIVVGCSVAPEYPLLQQFFSASRLRDLTALESIATTVFEPREQGTVATFDIVNVAARREGARELKDVTVSAPVRLPTGRTERKTLLVTLEKIDGRWMVARVR